MLFLSKICNKLPKICVIYFLCKVYFYIVRGGGRSQRTDVRGSKSEVGGQCEKQAAVVAEAMPGQGSGLVS
jgi:hypothetical protein